MPEFNRYELPTEIIYKGNRYILNLIATDQFRKFPNKGILRVDMDAQNLNWMVVNVLSKKLRQRTDLTQKPHQPSKWVFTCSK